MIVTILTMTLVLTLGALKGDRFYGSGDLNRENQIHERFQMSLTFEIKVHDKSGDSHLSTSTMTKKIYSIINLGWVCHRNNLDFKVNDGDGDLHEEQKPHGAVPPSPTHLQQKVFVKKYIWSKSEINRKKLSLCWCNILLSKQAGYGLVLLQLWPAVHKQTDFLRKFL